MKIKKKYSTGASRNYITRTQAIRKLQVSLADFRRLCIFKGIYPREPRNKRKANKGSTTPTTFYYYKDIQYLLHEPVLQKFRDHKTFAKKLTRALGRGDVGDAKRLDDNRPKYRLDHIVKERYPTFIDALRDIDDALSLLFLFSTMPATDVISQRVTETAEQLCNQWMAFVSNQRLLRKVFVSIKGIYYQCEIKGQEITWVVPFKFTPNVPTDVDFRIMLTFLEFYTTLIRFVLFKLYTEAGYVYPPRADPEKIKGIGGLSAFLLESVNAKSFDSRPLAIKQGTVSATDVNEAIKDAANAEEEADGEADNGSDEIANEQQLDAFVPIENGAETGDVLAQPVDTDSTQFKNLFSGFTFFIGREVPVELAEFVIVSFGGRVISESAYDDALAKILESDATESYALKSLLPEGVTITHQIVDRPVIRSKVAGRVYIQPQWIFDSVNKGELLPVIDYAPGAELPPHLSPWGDSGTYNPEEYSFGGRAENAEEEEEENSEDEEDAAEEEEEAELAADAAEDAMDTSDDEYQKQLEAELKGDSVAVQSEEKKSKKAEKRLENKKKRALEDEDKELRKMMMSNKQRKLYEKMQYGIKQQDDRSKALSKKRRTIEKEK
ncbi:hypothetical protein CANCADRAFT_37612, partial [Tortispora caseinolytica NRRL Y-17796]